MKTKTKKTDRFCRFSFWNLFQGITQRTKCAEALDDPGVYSIHFKVEQRIKLTIFLTQIKCKWESICPVITFLAFRGRELTWEELKVPQFNCSLPQIPTHWLSQNELCLIPIRWQTCGSLRSGQWNCTNDTFLQWRRTEMKHKDWTYE